MSGTRRGGRGAVLRRLLVGLLLVLLALPVAGLIYQAAGAARDEQAYPPPGQLIDVGGYRLHLHCLGAGSPTVILEAAWQGATPNWGRVQPELTRTNRVCAYDRAGMGWSDPAPAPQDARQVAEALDALLTRAGIDGPLVLVGHSLGGHYVRAYAERRPERVAGVVLLDASHPDQLARIPEQRAELEAFRRDTSLYTWLARFGLFRLYFALGGEIDCAALPARQCDEIKAVWSEPGFWSSMHGEMGVRTRADDQVRAAGDLGARPLIVVSAGAGSSPAWLDLQRDLVGLSTNGVQRVSMGASHMGLVFEPEHAAATVAAIRETLAAAGEGRAVRP